MADILLDNLPRTWAGRPIDWDFRPMVWFNGQYLRLPEDEKGLPELARETMRRFYCVAVPPEEEVDAFKALVEFYTAGPQEVADRPGKQPHRGAGAGLHHRRPRHRGRIPAGLLHRPHPGKAPLVAVQSPHVQPARGDPAGEDYRVPDG